MYTLPNLTLPTSMPTAYIIIIIIKGINPQPGHWIVPGQVLKGKRPTNSHNHRRELLLLLTSCPLAP